MNVGVNSQENNFLCAQIKVISLTKLTALLFSILIPFYNTMYFSIVIFTTLSKSTANPGA